MGSILNPLMRYQAVGDAFGAPFEFHGQAFELALQSIEETRFLDAVQDCGSPKYRGRLPGLYTDDTQQALILDWLWKASVKAGGNPLDAAHIGDRFMKICTIMANTKVTHPSSFGTHRGTGKNFRTCITTQNPVLTPGAGAAMRIGPLMARIPALPIVTPWVSGVSSVTTADRTGLFSACAYAEHVWSLYHRGTNHIHKSIQHGMDILDSRGHDACVAYVTRTWKPTEDIQGLAYGYGPSCVIWTTYIAEKATSVEQALVDACSYGGDTDTICAMVMCILGAKGMSLPSWMEVDIPEDWHPNHEKKLTEKEARHIIGLLP